MTVRDILAKLSKATAAFVVRFFTELDRVPTDQDLMILSVAELVTTLPLEGLQQLMLLEHFVECVRANPLPNPAVLVLLDDDFVLLPGQLPRSLIDLQLRQDPLPAWVRMVTYNLTHLVLINKNKRWKNDAQTATADK